MFEARLGQIVHETFSLKYPTQNRAGKMAQVVEPGASMKPGVQTPAPRKEKEHSWGLGV
jgi:hypothetical protein